MVVIHYPLVILRSPIRVIVLDDGLLIIIKRPWKKFLTVTQFVQFITTKFKFIYFYFMKFTVLPHTKIFLTYQSDILEFVMITAFIAVTIEKCRYFHQELENFLSWTTDKAFYLSVIQSCTDLSADKLCYRWFHTWFRFR